MFLTPKELKTHLYREDIALIQGDDDTILLSAIDTAVAEARGYLARYDVAAVFGAVGEERNALLLTFTKDIAVWHFLNLCNSGNDLDLRRFRYERAIDWLKAVQRGDVTPDLPIRDEDGDGRDDGPGDFLYGSNPKRSQHF